MEPQPTSIASLKKKRKQQDSQPEKHLAKHVCREKVEGDEPARGCESEPESTNSNSFHSNCEDSFMCSDDEDKTDGGFQETPATSSASWAGTSSGASPYSSENRSSVNISTREPESLSMNEDQHDQHDVGFGWEGHAEIELYTDKELEDLLYSNGAAPGGAFILSSGRWSVDQGARAMQEEGKKKLTIDKEFEQFFSMLML
ncbi:protein FAR-RED ELONGATED HYPOCOTYL 1-like [Salvia hispanica]|uniref:protein FAR-RED ELONGATED HYPOCOTYL 1-like n=1 Tax=Salvia hispanica TaxID=49212 RepID=UPI0020094E87|nr:protein FAR-RED ELONGATED HYPOCOTYL 1-like [Salvia hispanica]